MAVTSIDAKGVHIRKLMPSFKEDSNTWETMADMLVRGGPYVCWYCKAVARGQHGRGARAKHAMQEVRALPRGAIL